VRSLHEQLAAEGLHAVADAAQPPPAGASLRRSRRARCGAPWGWPGRRRLARAAQGLVTSSAIDDHGARARCRAAPRRGRLRWSLRSRATVPGAAGASLAPITRTTKPRAHQTSTRHGARSLSAQSRDVSSTSRSRDSSSRDAHPATAPAPNWSAERTSSTPAAPTLVGRPPRHRLHHRARVVAEAGACGRRDLRHL
jgi:hypothetical protein